VSSKEGEEKKENAKKGGQENVMDADFKVEDDEK